MPWASGTNPGLLSCLFESCPATDEPQHGHRQNLVAPEVHESSSAAVLDVLEPFVYVAELIADANQ